MRATCRGQRPGLGPPRGPVGPRGAGGGGAGGSAAPLPLQLRRGEMHCWWVPGSASVYSGSRAGGGASKAGGGGSAVARRLLWGALERYGGAGGGGGVGGGSHGKPLLDGPGAAGLHVSLTHTDGAVGCVVARHPVGLDCEPLTRAPRLGAIRVARRRFSPDEVAQLEQLPPVAQDAAFLRTWTLKEALVKATGRGISASPGSLRGFSVLPGAAEPPPLEALRAWFPGPPQPLVAAGAGGVQVVGIRLVAQDPAALQVLPEELPGGSGADGNFEPWLAAFDSATAADPAGSGRGDAEEVAWRHMVALCAFLPPGEQPVLRMFDGTALLRGVDAEPAVSPPAGLRLTACTPG